MGVICLNSLGKLLDTDTLLTHMHKCGGGCSSLQGDQQVQRNEEQVNRVELNKYKHINSNNEQWTQ